MSYSTLPASACSPAMINRVSFRWCRTVAASASVVLTLWAGMGIVYAEDAELNRHRALWAQAGSDNYSYGYEKYCACHRDTPPQTFVTVESGVVVRVYHVHDDSDRQVPAREGSLDLYWTIVDLFALVARAEERGVSYRARYDETLGYPNYVYIDYDTAAVGDELDIRLTAFELLD